MDTMPQLSSSPPPLCNEVAGSEEEECGDLSAGADGSDVSSVEAVSKLTKTSPTLNQYTSHSTTTTLNLVEQSQPTSTVNLKPTDDQARLEDSSHLKNGYPCSVGDQMSVLNSCSVTNETDFADFSVFGEQGAHAWCCGLGGAEFRDGSEGVTTQKGLSEHFASGQEVILDCEPKSFTVTSKREICTKVNHCDKKTKSSQDIQGIQHFQMEGCYFEDKTLSKYGESHKERKHSFNLNFLRTSNEAEQTEREERGKKEKSVSTLSQAARLYEGIASCDEDSSQDEPSDFEPNVSSLASQDEGTDTEDQTDDEEELRNYRLSRSFCNNDICYSLQISDSDVGLFDQSAAQESSATSFESECEPHTDDDQVFFRCVSFRPQKAQEHVQLAEGEVQSLGILPPSDSFADFCSASSQEDGEREWALFQEQPDKQEGFGQLYDLTSGQVVLQCQVQQVFQDSFPEVVSEEIEEPVHGLHALLFLKKLNGHKGEEEPTQGLDHQRVIPGMWWPSQDIHSATGLQYQWSGSHINKSLLRCLDVDTGNIVFVGIKKHPVVPACASHLVYHLV